MGVLENCGTILHGLRILQRYERRQEVRAYEKRKEIEALAAAEEVAKEEKETNRMLAEERRSWDAYELNARNHIRMINKVLACRVSKLRHRRVPGGFHSSFRLGRALTLLGACPLHFTFPMYGSNVFSIVCRPATGPDTCGKLQAYV